MFQKLSDTIKAENHKRGKLMHTQALGSVLWASLRPHCLHSYDSVSNGCDGNVSFQEPCASEGILHLNHNFEHHFWF